MCAAAVSDKLGSVHMHDNSDSGTLHMTLMGYNMLMKHMVCPLAQLLLQQSFSN